MFPHRPRDYTRTIAASRPSTHFAAIWTTSRNRWYAITPEVPQISNWQLYNWSAYAGMIQTPPISPIVLFFPAIDATVPNFPKCGTRHYVIWGSSLRRPHHRPSFSDFGSLPSGNQQGAPTSAEPARNRAEIVLILLTHLIGCQCVGTIGKSIARQHMQDRVRN